MNRMAWSDERMDDFVAHTYRRFDGVDKRFDGVDKRFDGVDKRLDGVDKRLDAIERRFDSVERRMEAGFNRVDAEIASLRGEMNTKFEHLEERIYDVNRTMMRLGGGALVTFVVGFTGLIVTQL
jgi:archaellum component FlaC